MGKMKHADRRGPCQAAQRQSITAAAAMSITRYSMQVGKEETNIIHRPNCKHLMRMGE